MDKRKEYVICQTEDGFVSDTLSSADEIGDLSDGFHTYNELYDFRKVYNAMLFNEWSRKDKYNVYKSKRHSDGELCFGGGWFVVSATLPTGQITNHYEMKDWDLFEVEEKEMADEWDGHTPQQALERMLEYITKYRNLKLNPIEPEGEVYTIEQQMRDAQAVEVIEHFCNKDNYFSPEIEEQLEEHIRQSTRARLQEMGLAECLRSVMKTVKAICD